MYLDVSVKTPASCELFERDPALGAAESKQADALMMGDIARTSDEMATFDVKVIGSAPIEKIEFFDGAELIEVHRPRLGRRGQGGSMVLSPLLSQLLRKGEATMTKKSFDVVFGMEDDITAVIDYASVLANGLLDEDVPDDIGAGLRRVACDARQAGHRLMEQFNTALELARQEKRA